MLPITVIACEGQTEVAYFEAIRMACRKPPELIQVVRKGTAPVSVVELAEERRKELESNKNWRPGDSNWAVFDGEEHQQTAGQRQGWNDAIQRAQSRGVGLATSDPCFELWLLLHHQEQRAALHRTEAKNKLEKANPDYAKGTKGSVPYGEAVVGSDSDPSYTNAHKRSRQLSSTPTNPLTHVHHLTEHLRKHYLPK